MNSNVDLSSTLGSADQRKSGNPGLEYIWEDEKLRRTAMRLNSKKHPLTPPSSPPRNRPPDHATESEKHWEAQFAEALSEWTEKGVFERLQLSDVIHLIKSSAFLFVSSLMC